MNKTIIALVAILILGGGAFLLLKSKSGSPVLPQTQPQTQSPKTSTPTENFPEPKKSAHYESNTPEHGAVLAGVPVNAVIDFNFDLAKGSAIKIEMTGRDYGVGDTLIDSNKLVMRRKMDPSSPDGIYTVSYKACWADGSCHDGEFQFRIDRSSASQFIDMTGKKEITINMQNVAFSPAKVKISKGSTVTWTNQDNITHTVNTDPHPGHSYYPNQNSRDLKSGDSYSLTFADDGIYPYHCTPHASSMKGQILVE